MRALVLTTIITLASGGLVALAACGGSEETSVTPGDGGGSEASSGGSSGSDARNDTGGSSSGSSACNSLSQLGQLVTPEAASGMRPNGTGGTVLDGKYVLTRVQAYGVPQSLLNGRRLDATTIEITGSTIQAVTTDPMNVKGHHTLTFTKSGAANFQMVTGCSTTDSGTLNLDGTYTADNNDAGTPRLRIFVTYNIQGFDIDAVAHFTKM